MDLYEKNLEIFKLHSSDIYELLTFHGPIYNVKSQKVESVQNNFLLKSTNCRCFTHSIYDINREMEEMFRGADRNTENLIIFGFGCGYFIDYINKYFKNIKQLIIIEPNLPLFQEVLKTVDLMALSCCGNVVFILNKNEEEAGDILLNIIKGNMKGSFEVVYHMYIRTMFHGYFENLNKFVSTYIKHLKINLDVINKTKYLWAVNSFMNLRESTFVTCDKLVEDIEGLTAVIVSAGPSLNENIKELKKMKDKALIVAVGSAIKILNEHRVIPHLRVSIDANESNNPIFDNINSEDAPLIYSPKLYYEILPKYKGKKVLMITKADYLLKYIYELQNKKYIEFESSFSVATVALFFLCCSKCEKIIFVGQDMSFTNRKLYANGSWGNNDEIDFSNGKYLLVKNVNGEQVYTTSAFLGIKEQMESVVKAFSDIVFLNATEGGLEINGAKNVALKEIADELVGGLDIKSIIDNAIQPIQEESVCDAISICMLKIGLEIDDIISNHARIMDLLGSFRDKELNINEINELETKIGNIENLRKDYEKIGFYSRVVMPEIYEVLSAIRIGNEYNDNDKLGYIVSKINTIFSQELEIGNYMKVIKRMFDDYKAVID